MADGRLAGVRIALLFQEQLIYSIRIRRSLDALRSEGASISLVSVLDNSAVADWFDGCWRCDEYEPAPRIGASRLRWSRLRSLDNVIRNMIRPYLVGDLVHGRTRLRDCLVDMGEVFDIYWAIDVMALPSAVVASRVTGARVVYETFDLVQEYASADKLLSKARAKAEREHIGAVSAFVTAGSGYAAYYAEKYLGTAIKCPPYVLDNHSPVPPGNVSPAHRPLELLFFGNLAPDRPLNVLLEAFSRGGEGLVLTMQGRDNVEGAAHRMVEALGLKGSVSISEPCSPEDGPLVARGYDIGVVMLAGADENERRAATAKASTYLAAGLMVLASDLPGIRTALGSGPNVLYVPEQTVEAWAAAFRRVAGFSEQEVLNGKMASLSIARTWDDEAQMNGYVQLFVDAARGKTQCDKSAG